MLSITRVTAHEYCKTVGPGAPHGGGADVNVVWTRTSSAIGQLPLEKRLSELPQDSTDKLREKPIFSNIHSQSTYNV